MLVTIMGRYAKYVGFLIVASWLMLRNSKQALGLACWDCAPGPGMSKAFRTKNQEAPRSAPRKVGQG